MQCTTTSTSNSDSAVHVKILFQGIEKLYECQCVDGLSQEMYY